MKSVFFSYYFYVFVNVSSLYISTSSQVLDYRQDLMKQNYYFNTQNFPEDACKWCFLHSGESPAQEEAYQPTKCTIFLTDKFMILQFLWHFYLLQVTYNQTLNNYGQCRWKTDILQLISAFFLNAPCFQSMKKY